MSVFFDLINKYRAVAKSESEKGTYFEALCIKYFENEPYYVDLFAQVQTYTDWAKAQGLSGKDTGIDLVATTKTANFMPFNANCTMQTVKYLKPKLTVFCQQLQEPTLNAVIL